MSKKVERAKELFLEGYNCAQAVVGAFCEDVGMDFDTAIKISSSFGAGMGKLREVCGALSGAFMVAGLKCGYTSPTDNIAKAEHYKLIQDISEKFKEQTGSIICRELLKISKDEKQNHIPGERTVEYYKTRPCVAMVEIAASVVEDVLNIK